MNRFRIRSAWLTVPFCALLVAKNAPGQETPPADPKGEDVQESGNTSQETDINEDNYRRFMELRDQDRQRPSAPYAVLAPPSSLEKLGRLPEESQKHLRNQLLGIILEGGRWTPEDANRQYPFVPSEAATADAQLRNSEAEAWAELVENYHARESQIYQAGERARSASVADGANSANAESPMSDAEQNRSRAGAQGSSHSSSRPRSASAPGTPASEEKPRDAGLTVNALDYLMGGASGSRSSPDPAGSPSSGAAPAAAQSRAESSRGDQAENREMAQAGRDGGAPGSPTADQGAARASDSPNPSTQPSADSADSLASESDSTAADSSQAAAAPPSAQSARSSNAERNSDANATSDEAQPDVEYISEGVIAIRDLKKVKGTQTGVSEQEQDEEEP